MTIATKPVRRETLTLSRRRPLCASLSGRTLTLWEKKRPKTTTVEVPIDAIYQLGCKIIARERAAVVAKRKGGAKHA